MISYYLIIINNHLNHLITYLKCSITWRQAFILALIVLEVDFPAQISQMSPIFYEMLQTLRFRLLQNL